MAGSLFGAGWCFWLDAVLINGLNSHNVPFVEVRLHETEPALRV